MEEYKILEANGVENENIDGAGFNNFCASGKDGIVKGILNECNITVSNNTLTIEKGELIIQGFRVKLLQPRIYSFSTPPAAQIDYYLVATITVDLDRTVTFSLDPIVITELRKDNLFETESGTYQVALCKFTHNTDNSLGNLELLIEPSFAQAYAQGTDVQINGTSITTDGVANIPIGSDKLGVVKSDSSYGVSISRNGALNIYRAFASNIRALNNIRSVYCPITPINMHYAIKTAIATMLTRKDAVTPSGVSLDAEYSEVLLNDSEKAAAQEWLGVTEKLSGYIPQKVTTQWQTFIQQSSADGVTPGPITTMTVAGGASANSIPQRTTTGAIKTATPTEDEHAATKKYVDDSIPKLYKHVFRVSSYVDVSIFMTLCLTNSIETAMIATGDEIYEEDKLQELIGILNNLYSSTIPDINGYVEDATATNAYPIVAANTVRARNNINIQYIGKSDVDDSRTVITGVDLFASVIACTVDEEIIEIN